MAGSSSSSSSSAPAQCLGGCGFYGNAAFSGYCSQCFKKRHPASPATGATPAPAPAAVGGATPVGSASAPAASSVTSPLLGGARGGAVSDGAAGTSGGGGVAPVASAIAPTVLSALSLHGVRPAGVSASAPGPAVAAAAPTSDGDVVMSSSPAIGIAGAMTTAAGVAASSSAASASAPVTPKLSGGGSSGGGGGAGGAVSGAGALGGGAGSTLSPLPRSLGVAAAAVGSATPASIAGASLAGDVEMSTPGGSQKNRSRCWSCKKKVGLTGFECRCGYVFCGSHRYAEEHNCTFNHAEHDRSILAKATVRVVGDKMEKV